MGVNELIKAGMTRRLAKAAATTGGAGEPVVASMVAVAHGTNAGLARPVGAVAVYWTGSVAPANAAEADLWLEP